MPTDIPILCNSTSHPPLLVIHWAVLRGCLWFAGSVEFGHGGVNATLPLGAVVAVDGAQGIVEMPTSEELADYDDSKL